MFYSTGLSKTSKWTHRMMTRLQALYLCNKKKEKKAQFQQPMYKEMKKLLPIFNNKKMNKLALN